MAGAMSRNVTWLALLVLVLGCGAPQQPGPASSGADRPKAPTTKRITAAVMNDLEAVVQTVVGEGGPGGQEMELLVMSGLTTIDQHGVVQPQLAETVPTIENGLWRVFPDGRMETTWKIRASASWQDGARFTSEDLLFTAQVEQDPDVPIRSRNRAYRFIDSLETPDPETLTIKWKSPYIWADTLFGSRSPWPWSKHRLGKIYTEDKARLTQAIHWTAEFVGTGPYKVQEWAQGRHVLLSAYDGYVLGRPKIDEIEVKFIPDANAFGANILAGAVELTIGRNFTITEAMPIGEQWRDGKVEVPLKSWIMMFPQFLEPSPEVILDMRFRRALLHATDRQQMADNLVGPGISSVAHSFIGPDFPEYRQVEGRVVRYEYDPRKAVQMIEQLGYTRGADGVFRDTAGRRLSVEIRQFGTEMGRLATLVTADYWQRVGVAVDLQIVPQALEGDRAWMFSFPGFLLLRQGNEPRALADHYSLNAPLPENRFTGRSRSRYMNADFDGLLDRYFSTVPKAERTQALGDILYHISDQLNLMGLFYDTQPMLVGNRLMAVTPSVGDSLQGWNAHEWDVKS